MVTTVTLLISLPNAHQVHRRSNCTLDYYVCSTHVMYRTSSNVQFYMIVIGCFALTPSVALTHDMCTTVHVHT